MITLPMASIYHCSKSFRFRIPRWRLHVGQSLPKTNCPSSCTRNSERRIVTLSCSNYSLTENLSNGRANVKNSSKHSTSSNAQRKVLLKSSSSSNLPSVHQIEFFLSSKKIPFEHGHTSIVVSCTNCEGASPEKTVYINKTTASYFCKSCGKSGFWGQFKAQHIKSSDAKIIPPEPEIFQIRTINNSDSHQKAQEVWKNSQPLHLSSNVHDVFSNFDIQNLSDEFLSKYQVQIVDYKFVQPCGSSSHHPCLVFPWFDPSSSAVNGVKLVRVDQQDKGSITLQPRLGSLGLFGWNTIQPDAKEVVLTLNEFDAIAVNQETSYPAISLPLGTHSLPPEVLPQMEQFERIFLWFGEDVRAQQAANYFSRKLNVQRCHIVRPPVGGTTPMGALNALNKGVNFKQLFKSSKPISHDKIHTFYELRDDIYNELVNADQVAGVQWSRFSKLNSILKGHRRGELTIFTGPTGSGKTTFLSEMSLDLCQQGVNTLWGSFEIRNVRLGKIMLNQFSGVNLQKNVKQFGYWADKFEMLPMYFMSFYGSQSIKTVIETMSHAAYVFDIEHVVIDNLQFMTSNARDEDRFAVHNHVVSCFRDFASTKNIHVTLVVHPRKEDDRVELQTASIFGSAKASQEADNIMILQDKGRGNKYIQVTKNRFDGTCGRISLEFVKTSLSMCGFGKADSSESSINKDSSQKITKSIVSSSNNPPLAFKNKPKVDRTPVTPKQKSGIQEGDMSELIFDDIPGIDKWHLPGQKIPVTSPSANKNFQNKLKPDVKFDEEIASDQNWPKIEEEIDPTLHSPGRGKTGHKLEGVKLMPKTVSSLTKNVNSSRFKQVKKVLPLQGQKLRA